jgi:hypothetical protein
VRLVTGGQFIQNSIRLCSSSNRKIKFLSRATLREEIVTLPPPATRRFVEFGSRKRHMTETAQKISFRSRARLLQHLGDQLIGTPRLAVFELVKNGYDADASYVSVTIEGLGSKRPTIRIRDDGSGMSIDIVKDIWLVIAHDHKEKSLRHQSRSPKGRLPLGSKGLGRLSVHKLGNKIEMVTKSSNCQEVTVKIDWAITRVSR